MKQIVNLAFDFGASSGRLFMSKFHDHKIELKEIHRFPNNPVKLNNVLYWDFLRLFHELLIGLKKAAKITKKIDSIGIDCWGVDYGLLDKNGTLLTNPIHYRDGRTSLITNEINENINFKEVYAKTGVQSLHFSTIYQLYADSKLRPNILNNADCCLFMPDLFNYFLTSKKYNEYTIASTSELINIKSKTWDSDLFLNLKLPGNLMQKIIMPGEILGYLTDYIQKEVGLDNVPVVAVASHDTASAVASVPFENQHSAYLISGTWSILGVENNECIINKDSFESNFANEAGAEGKIRFLNNINGLWIMQQLRKSWSQNINQISFEDITKEAIKCKHCTYTIDPNFITFRSPTNMILAIQNYCKNTNQGIPIELGELAIAVYNGLTNEYKKTINKLESILDKKLNTINMVGGGIQDKFLCQLTSDITGKKVIAGPVEASALGNIIIQLKSLGQIENLSEGREIIKNSFKLETYIPN